MAFTFKLRRGTSVQWRNANPILNDGEPGVETDTRKFKIGNGLNNWIDLPYYLSEDAITDYINEQFDNLPPIGPEQLDEVTDQVLAELELTDLVLLWENAKA